MLIHDSKNIPCSVEIGIDLYAEDNNGDTAFHYACDYGNAHIVQLFLENSSVSDLSAKNNEGKTALDYKRISDYASSRLRNLIKSHQ